MKQFEVMNNPEFGLRMIAGFCNPCKIASAEEMALASFYANQIEHNLTCIKILIKTGFHPLIAQKARQLTSAELYELVETGSLDDIGPSWSDLIEANERTGANVTFFEHLDSILNQIVEKNDTRLLDACLRNAFWQHNNDFVGVLLTQTDDNFFLKTVEKLHAWHRQGRTPSRCFWT